MMQQDRDAFPQVEVAAAPESDDHVRLEPVRQRGCLVDRSQVDLRLPASKRFHLRVIRPQQRFDLRRDPARHDVRIRANQDPSAEIPTDIAKLLDSPEAEEDSTGSRESPGSPNR
jgi:hypothetical protein